VPERGRNELGAGQLGSNHDVDEMNALACVTEVPQVGKVSQPWPKTVRHACPDIVIPVTLKIGHPIVAARSTDLSCLTHGRIHVFQRWKGLTMQPRTFIFALAACVITLPVLASATPESPYAGQQARSIKALSEEDIAALRKGEGMGMAKAAELNGYPGPVHVLTLAEQLGLTEDQLKQVTAIYNHMSTAAKPLGDELISREQALDQLFAKGEITPAHLTAATAAIGELQGRLRSVHLAAHLEIRALLNTDQIALYQRLRGYGDPTAPAHHHHG
jgi:Spy/CpxP family protein refolding chaperone